MTSISEISSLIKKDTSSIILSIGDSETSLIDNMRYSGIFEREEILNEPITHGSLLNGRHRITTSLSFKSGEKIEIKGVQYEIDACYESKNKILIIEGKKDCKSFNIRQLYFPFREIYNKIGSKKEIICLFVFSKNNIIYIWKYIFEDPLVMDSIKLTGYFKFKFIN